MASRLNAQLQSNRMGRNFSRISHRETARFAAGRLISSFAPFKQRDSLGIRFTAKLRTVVPQDGDLAQIEDPAAFLEMAAKRSFLRCRERNVDMRLSICDNSSGIQNLEGPLH